MNFPVRDNKVLLYCIVSLLHFIILSYIYVALPHKRVEESHLRDKHHSDTCLNMLRHLYAMTRDTSGTHPAPVYATVASAGQVLRDQFCPIQPTPGRAEPLTTASSTFHLSNVIGISWCRFSGSGLQHTITRKEVITL